MPKAIVKASKGLALRITRKLDHMQPETEAQGTFAHARSTLDSPTRIRYVVTTGIRTFDDRVGGMPVGKAVELVGLPKSGKTSCAVRTCIRAQQGFIYERVPTADGGIKLEKLKPGTFNVTTIYYDNEGSLSDFSQRQVDGVVMDGEIIQCETIELLWKTMDGIMEEIEKEEQESGILQFVIVVIDTVGSMTTKSELESAWGKQDYPRVPYHLKVGFKTMTSRMQRENVMLIGLNHVSKKMMQRGQMAYRGWNYDSPGGMAFGYFATFQIYFEMLQTKYSLRGKGGEADGILIYFLTLKNRMLPMLRQGRMALLFGIKDRATGKLTREGGLKDDYSLLETLIFSKAAKVSKETGTITFYFEKFGALPSLPVAATPSLEEQDDDAPAAPVTTQPSRRMGRSALEEPEKKRRDPRILNRLAWPAFYAEHQVAVDRLYEIVTDRALSASESASLADAEDADEDEDESDN